MDEFGAAMALLIMMCAFGAGAMFGIGLEKTKIETGKTIIIDNSSYRCKMVNTLKE